MTLKTIITEEINDTLIQQWIQETIGNANDFLTQYGMSVTYNALYNFQSNTYYQRCYAIYQRGSVKHKGRIKIGINIPHILEDFGEHLIEREVKTSIWHEVGHGIVEYLKGLRRKDTQLHTNIVRGKMLRDLRDITGDEENRVEDFAYQMTQRQNWSELGEFLETYRQQLDTIRQLEGGPQWTSHFRQETS